MCVCVLRSRQIISVFQTPGFGNPEISLLAQYHFIVNRLSELRRTRTYIHNIILSSHNIMCLLRAAAPGCDDGSGTVELILRRLRLPVGGRSRCRELNNCLDETSWSWRNVIRIEVAQMEFVYVDGDKRKRLSFFFFTLFRIVIRCFRIANYNYFIFNKMTWRHKMYDDKGLRPTG